MSRFALLLDGSLRVTERLRGQLKGARVIAADGGIRHARQLGVEAELWLGDFDSAGEELEAAYAHIPRQKYPAAKDQTDGELCINAALGRGATEIVMVGALGGESSDHALCHLLTSLTLAGKGISVVATSGDEEAWPLLPGSRRMRLPVGARFSLLALDDLDGLSLQGLKWPLEDRRIETGSSLTLSNRVTGPVEVSLTSGRGIIFVRP